MRHFSDISATAQRLVDVAQALIQQHGYNGFSYDDIAREVGIKKPSIHHHFATKAELVRIVVQRYAHTFGALLEQIDARHQDAGARLLAYAELFAQTYQNERRLCLCGILGAEADALSADVALEVRGFFQFNLAWLVKTMELGAAAGALRLRGGAKEQAYALLAVLEGAMLVGRGLGSDGSPAAAGQTYISNLLA
ncbi:TetR/AcrR family transcriptional regulator, transcriptional repressor for nem operon [Janthinobacterium sp. CG_23.3]|uniref:TetR/AcrR family transcriptional regulator n=1 Tax=Janthinobacterium sp. CG_23.3 TaxID=3349634 RepID=UPI0038D3C63B